MRVGSTAEYEDEAPSSSSQLGKGAFGIVVRARHRATGKTVAIKSLRPSPSTAHDDPSELVREAHLLITASRGNPYVVGFHGLVRHPQTCSFRLAMEYAGPRNLRAFLRPEPATPSSSSDQRRHHDVHAVNTTTLLPEPTVRAFMWQLLTGARTMHERGIVHRDIKPSNVLVGDDGRTLKLCDLGLAVSLAPGNRPYDPVGTPCYKAPEVLMGSTDYDERVDAWSLGCVMAEMLTGRKLFDGGDGDVGELLAIFGVLGTPDEGSWPGCRSLPARVPWHLLRHQQRQSKLAELFPDEKLSRDGFHVLEGLLRCNPDHRLTAAAALQLPWFDAVALLQIQSKKKNILKVPLTTIWNKLRTATRSKTHGSTYDRLSTL